jgi:hypothetical protein
MIAARVPGQTVDGEHALPARGAWRNPYLTQTRQGSVSEAPRFDA